MDLTPYVSNLRHELAVAADAGGDDARALAERLTAPLESAVRLVLLDALSAAAAAPAPTGARRGAGSATPAGCGSDAARHHFPSPASTSDGRPSYPLTRRNHHAYLRHPRADIGRDRPGRRRRAHHRERPRRHG